MGTSAWSLHRRCACLDHPHAYGDKKRLKTDAVSKKGSSPRVWGQAYSLQSRGLCYRIIPTRMGTSRQSSSSGQTQRDHPHAYGDKYNHCNAESDYPGSSPRVWGQDFTAEAVSYNAWIIPTRMGTSLKKSRKIAVLQNQPLRFPLTFHRSFV